MQDLLEELSYDMPVRKETKEEIVQEVALQLSRAIESLKPKGLRRVLHWIREWGATGAVVTCFLAPIGIAVTLAVVAFNRVDQNARFQTRTEDRLSRIEADLRTLKNMLSPISAAIGDPTSAKTQSPERLAYRFKEAKLMIGSAIENKITTDPRVLEVPQKNLQEILHTVALPETVKQDGTSLLINLEAYKVFSEDILSGQTNRTLSNVILDGKGCHRRDWWSS